MVPLHQSLLIVIEFSWRTTVLTGYIWQARKWNFILRAILFYQRPTPRKICIINLYRCSLLHTQRQVLLHHDEVCRLNQYNDGWGIGRGEFLQKYIPHFFWLFLVHNIAKVSFISVNNITVLKNYHKVDECRIQ